MLAKKKEKDVIDRMLDQKIDFHGMTAEELAGENGLLKKLTSRFYSKVLDAEMDKHLGYKKMIIPAAIVVTVETVTQKKLL